MIASKVYAVRVVLAVILVFFGHAGSLLSMLPAPGRQASPPRERAADCDVDMPASQEASCGFPDGLGEPKSLLAAAWSPPFSSYSAASSISAEGSGSSVVPPLDLDSVGRSELKRTSSVPSSVLVAAAALASASSETGRPRSVSGTPLGTSPEGFATTARSEGSVDGSAGGLDVSVESLPSSGSPESVRSSADKLLSATSDDDDLGPSELAEIAAGNGGMRRSPVLGAKKSKKSGGRSPGRFVADMVSRRVGSGLVKLPGSAEAAEVVLNPGFFLKNYHNTDLDGELYRDEQVFFFEGLFSGSVNVNVPIPLVERRRFSQFASPAEVAAGAKHLVVSGEADMSGGIFMATQACCCLNPELQRPGGLSWSEADERYGVAIVQIALHLAKRIAGVKPKPVELTARHWGNAGDLYRTVKWPHSNYAWDVALDGDHRIAFRVLMRRFVEFLKSVAAEREGRTLGDLLHQSGLKEDPLLRFEYLEEQLQAFVRVELYKDVIDTRASQPSVIAKEVSAANRIDYVYAKLENDLLRRGGVRKKVLVDLYRESDDFDGLVEDRVAKLVRTVVCEVKAEMSDVC